MPIALPPSANAAREPFGGETGALIRGFDWPSAGLPRLQTWPQSLRTVVDLMMTSPVAMVLLWGPDGVMIYNDAYRVFAHDRHPRLLGSKVLEGWPEVADFNRRVMEEGLAGRTLSFRDHELTLYRTGQAEQVWMNLDYSPVFDEAAEPAGVLAIVVEISEQVRLNRQLEAERAAVQRLIENAPGFMASIRASDHVFQMANAAYHRLVAADDLVGRSVREALPAVAGPFDALLNRVAESGQPVEGNGAEVARMTGVNASLEPRFVDFVCQPLRDAHGSIDAFFVSGHDVTERQRAFAALSESEERFRLIADSAPVPMWVSELGGRRRFVNRAYQEFLGETFERALDYDWRSILHPDDVARVSRESIEGEASLKPFSLEAQYRRRDGQWRWLRSTSQPRWGPSGEHAGFVGVAFDITDARNASEHQRLLINELNHRVKNTLATVQSLATQSLRGVEPQEGLRRFERRLLALSKAHDVLTHQNWEGAQLREIVHQALRPWREGREERFRLTGDDLTLGPRAALAVAMTLHELGTNAAKYGALSNDQGDLRVEWGSKDDLFELVWTERGGPPVAAPERRGFGSRLIERQLAHELTGRAEFDFRPQGLVCTLRAPLPLSAAPMTDPTRPH